MANVTGAVPMEVKSHSGPASEPPADRRRRRSFRVQPSTLLVVALLAIVAYLVLVPVATVIWGSFRTGPPGTDASYSAEKYTEAYGNSRIYKAALTTFIFAMGSTILALTIGGYLAWLVARTNVRGKAVITALTLFPIMLPGVLSSVAWVLLLNPSIGLVNQFMTDVFGVDGPVFNAYSLEGMIWAQGVDHITLPFLLIAAAFKAMDPSLEEASAASQANGWTTFRKVTLPLMRPALLASGLLMFVRGIETFEVPAVMGIPGKVEVFSTVVWLSTVNSADYNLAAAYAMGYVLVSGLGLWIYYRAVWRGERFTTVTGKAFRPAQINLGRARWAHTAGALVILTICVILPFAVTIWASLLPYFAPPSAESLEKVSLDAYREVLGSDLLGRAFMNNLKVGVLSSAAMVALATMISWVVLRTKVRGRKLLDVVAFLPIGIPGLVLGLAILWFYLSVPIPLYGTLTIIGVAFVAAYTPYALRGTHASISQISPELEEASHAAGAGGMRTFRKVLFPLISRGLLAAFIFVLTLTFKVLSLPILLFTHGNEVMPTLIYGRYIAGDYAALCAMGILLVIVLSVLSGLAYLLARRSGGLQMQA